MSDAPAKNPAPRKEVSGDFLDPETGQSHAYVARFKRVATDVIWSARVRLRGKWVVLNGGRVAQAGTERDDFVVSEIVRDSVLDTLAGADMDDTLNDAKRTSNLTSTARWAFAALVLSAVVAGIWAVAGS